MTHYDESSKPVGYIVYSVYGLQSHVVMNDYGVVFSCNPIIDNNGMARVYQNKEEAEMAKSSFHNRISKVVLITQFERDDFTTEA